MLDQPPRRVAAAALQELAAYEWPGNIRELENTLVRILTDLGPVEFDRTLEPGRRLS